MKKRTPTDAEKALWEEVNKTTERLRAAAEKAATQTQAPVESVPEPLLTPKHPITRRMATPPAPKIAPHTPIVIPNDTTMLDKRKAERLRGGKLPIEGRLDLHGLTLDIAHAQFTHFVHTRYALQQRCLLVITGKGKRSAEKGGVLRQQLPRWIEEPSLRAKILSLVPAHPKDGGTGAFYVLLKRQR